MMQKTAQLGALVGVAVAGAMLAALSAEDVRATAAGDLTDARYAVADGCSVIAKDGAQRLNASARLVMEGSTAASASGDAEAPTGGAMPGLALTIGGSDTTAQRYCDRSQQHAAG